MTRKLKKSLFGGNYFNDELKDAVKGRRPAEQKIEDAILATKDFFATKFDDVVRLAVYELHYEEFMKDGKIKDQKSFDNYYVFERGNECFNVIFALAKEIKKLYKDKLENAELDEICRMLVTFSYSIGDFNGYSFYTNSSNDRKGYLKSVDSIVEKITQVKPAEVEPAV